MAPRGDQLNVLGPAQLVSGRTNRVEGELFQEGVQGAPEDELELSMSDGELLALADLWERQFKSYDRKLEKRRKTNRLYYLGKQGQQENALDVASVPDNIIFEATETFLAQALARNPDPIVYTDNTDFGNEEASNIRTMLVALSDSLVLRQKLKMMVRHWNIYFLGILKHGYDNSIHEISTDVRNRTNFLLDPAGYVDEYGDFVGWLGEKITAPASVLAEMCPDKEQFIAEMVEYKMGTSVTWTEWWTDDYTFTTFKGNVLDKSRNPHFNYPRVIPEEKGEQVIKVLKEGRNHFARPKKPYTFLSVYSFQEQPDDETTLIEQNQRNQDYISERSKQMANNLRKANNSYVFNISAGYDEQKATQALAALEDGTGALEPVANAVRRIDAPTLPESFFKEQDGRIERLRSIYGTLGNTAIQQNKETTARGMILNQQRSSDRIGGTIGDSLNQVASSTFNWWVQLMHVYYDKPHKAAIMGKLRAVEEVSLSAESFTRRLVVMAAPDSTQPKDPITEANQALSYYEAGLPIDPKTVLKLSDFPDVDSTIEGGMLFKSAPHVYVQKNFPELAEMLGLNQQMPVPGAGPPTPGAVGPNVAIPSPDIATTAAPPNSASLSQVPINTPSLPQ